MKLISRRLLWHESLNCLAVHEDFGGIPVLTILDDEYDDHGSYNCWPLEYLRLTGWIDLGDL